MHHHDVHVGVGGGIFPVVEVEHAFALEDADRNRRHEAAKGFRRHLAHGIRQRNASAGDGGGAGAAIGLDDIAIELDGALAQAPQVHRLPKRAANQALDFHRATTLLAAHGLAIGAGVGGARQHAVLGSDPAATAAAQEAGHLILDAGRAEDAGVAKLNQYGTGWVFGELAGEAHLAQFVGRSTARTLAAGHGCSMVASMRGADYTNALASFAPGVGVARQSRMPG